jgi:hypothetical protein
MSLAFLLLKDKSNSIVTSSVTFNAPGNFIPPYGKTIFQITAKGTPGNSSFYYTTTVPGNPNYNPYYPASGGNPLGTNTFYYNTPVDAQNPTVAGYNYEYVPAQPGNVISYYPASGGNTNPYYPASGGNTNPYYPASGGNTNPSTPGNPGTTNPIVPGTSGSIVQVTQYVHVWDVFAPRFNTPGYTAYYSNIDYQPWNNGTYRLGYYFASPYYFEFASGQSWYEVYQSYTDLGQYTNPATGGNTNPSNSPTPGTTNPYTPASGGTTNPYTPASGGTTNDYYPAYSNVNPSTPAFYTSNANYNSFVPAFSYTTTVPGNPNYNPVVPASGGNVSGTNTVNQNVLVPGNAASSTNVLGVSLPGGAADSAAPVVGPTTISIDYTNAGTPISVPPGGYVTVNYKPKTAP